MPKQNWAEREQTKAVSIKSGLLTPWSVGRPVFLLAKITKLRKTYNYWCMLQCCMHKHRWLTCLLIKTPAKRVEPRVPLVGLLLRQLAAHPDHVAEPSHRPLSRHLAGTVLANMTQLDIQLNKMVSGGEILTYLHKYYLHLWNAHIKIQYTLVESDISYSDTLNSSLTPTVTLFPINLS